MLLLLSLAVVVAVVVVVCDGDVGFWPGLGCRVWGRGRWVGIWGGVAGRGLGDWGPGDTSTWTFLIFLTFPNDLHP